MPTLLTVFLIRANNMAAFARGSFRVAVNRAEKYFPVSFRKSAFHSGLFVFSHT
jgi:hypothetical protein